MADELYWCLALVATQSFQLSNPPIFHNTDLKLEKNGVSPMLCVCVYVCKHVRTPEHAHTHACVSWGSHQGWQKGKGGE